ncbi:unnamed protein product [Citrullus colocynthis]|uniref:Secreted protein n=1 Tax=Citrullus colocynthis TaxID=252529 RepID=A0ABP0Y637_9ROSI
MIASSMVLILFYASAKNLGYSRSAAVLLHCRRRPPSYTVCRRQKSSVRVATATHCVDQFIRSQFNIGSCSRFFTAAASSCFRSAAACSCFKSVAAP